MPSTASNSDRAIVTTETKHEAFSTSPDVCRVPGESSPKPFPNWVKSDKLKKGTARTFIAGAKIWTSSGELGPPSEPEHAGTDGGVQSGTYRCAARPTSHSSDLVIEGDWAVRAYDSTTQNDENTTGLVVPEAIANMLRALAGYGEECLKSAAKAGAPFIKTR